MKGVMEGVHFETAHFIKVRGHLMLSLYMADIEEAENILNIKRNTKANSPC